MKKLRFRTQINLALGAGLLLAVIVAVGSWLTIHSLIGNAKLENDTEVASLLLERVVSELKTAESVQRRYLLTGSAEDLQAYTRARSGVLAAMARARKDAVLSNPAALPALQELIGQRVVTMDQLVGVRQVSGLGAATALVGTASNRELRERVDALVAQTKAREADVLAGRRALTNAGAQRAEIVIAAGGILTIGLLAWALFLIQRYQAARWRAQQHLRARESWIRQIMDAVPALIAYADADRRVRFHNLAYAESLGRPSSEIHGRHLSEVLGQSYVEARDKIDQAFAGFPVTYSRQGIDAMGNMHDYEVKLLPRYGEHEEEGQVVGVYALGTDVTEFRRIDRMKSEFVSTVSHELRTPLTSIRGSLGLIAGGVAGPLPDKAGMLVDIAKDNCERLIRLINDILDSEKIESGQMRLEMRTLQLAPLLEKAIAANDAFAAQHQVKLVLDVAAPSLAASVDPDRFMQVVTNLVSNACKFSPPTSSVTVRLAAQDGRVRIEVRDQGPGIPAEFRQRIFRKFSQADSSDTRQKGGTGLGLNISRAIVERMGGGIDFRSNEDGAGTTFFFDLPRVGAAPATAAPAAASNRARILVVEDDPDIARLIAMMLDKAGFDTDIAATAEQAMEMVDVRRYAGMTVDIRLPGRDGFSLVRALRAQESTRNMPMVVVSASAEEGRLTFDTTPLMVSGWLQKPIDEDRLIQGLRRAIQEMPGARPRILHVEDDADIQRITAAIGQDIANFVSVRTLEEAREQLRSGSVDAVLLDLDLGDEEARGSSLFADLDQMQDAPPVVIFSAADVTDAERQRAAAIMMKSESTNEQVRDVLERVLAGNKGSS